MKTKMKLNGRIFVGNLRVILSGLAVILLVLAWKDFFTVPAADRMTYGWRCDAVTAICRFLPYAALFLTALGVRFMNNLNGRLCLTGVFLLTALCRLICGFTRFCGHMHGLLENELGILTGASLIFLILDPVMAFLVSFGKGEKLFSYAAVMAAVSGCALGYQMLAGYRTVVTLAVFGDLLYYCALALFEHCLTLDNEISGVREKWEHLIRSAALLIGLEEAEEDDDDDPGEYEFPDDSEFFAVNPWDIPAADCCGEFHALLAEALYAGETEVLKAAEMLRGLASAEFTEPGGGLYSREAIAAQYGVILEFAAKSDPEDVVFSEVSDLLRDLREQEDSPLYCLYAYQTASMLWGCTYGQWYIALRRVLKCGTPPPPRV